MLKFSRESMTGFPRLASTLELCYSFQNTLVIKCLSLREFCSAPSRTLVLIFFFEGWRRGLSWIEGEHSSNFRPLDPFFLVQVKSKRNSDLPALCKKYFRQAVYSSSGIVVASFTSIGPNSFNMSFVTRYFCAISFKLPEQ